MNILEKIKRDHAAMVARTEAERAREREHVAAELAAKAAPIKRQLESRVEKVVLAEELGDDAAAVLRAFTVEHEPDADLLGDRGCYSVRLNRDGLAPITVDLSRIDLSPIARPNSRYGVEVAGIWQVAGLYVTADGKIGDDEDCESIEIFPSFAEAVIGAERRYAWAVEQAEKKRASKDAPPPPDAGGSAFPSAESQTGGMRLRDYFAGQAMIGFQMHVKGGWAGVMPADMTAHVAANAYAIADAMLKARKAS